MITDPATTVEMTQTIADDLSILRLQVARYRSDLEEAEDQLAFLKAHAEQALIVSLGGDAKALGANESERARRLLLHVESNMPYLEQRRIVRALDRGLGLAQALLDSAIDRRREREHDVRLRTITLLESEHDEIDLTDRLLVGVY